MSRPGDVQREDVLADDHAAALRLAHNIVNGECSTFGDEVPLARALIAACALVSDLGRHLTALCDHPENWEHRYDLPAGKPCPGCYDARDAFAAWHGVFGRQLQDGES